jgi:hypothetical protein
MGDVVDISRARGARPSTKMAPGDVDASLNAAIDAQLEALKAAYGQEWAGWRLRKKHPDERQFLITLAENLHGILKELGHGRRGKALSAAAGPRTAATGDANKYVTRLTLEPKALHDEKRIELLTPCVGKYIAVARRAGEIVTGHGGAPGDPTFFLARLFRNTPLDRRGAAVGSAAPWAENLASLLDRVCDAVARRYRLGPLFDRMDAANIHAEDAGPDARFMMTAWLSETFHKTAFNHGPDEAEGFLAFERTDEGAPWGGAPLFVPKAMLFREERHVQLGTAVAARRLIDGQWVDGDAGEGADVDLRFSIEVWLAVGPDAADHVHPCLTRGWLLVRPTVRMGSEPDAAAVTWVGVTADSVSFYAQQDEMTGTLLVAADGGAALMAALDDRLRRWFDEGPQAWGWLMDEPGADFRINLPPGSWWVVALLPPNVERLLGRPADDPRLALAFDVPERLDLTAARVEESYASDTELALSAVAPQIAPASSVANALQLHLMHYKADAVLLKALELDARQLSVRFTSLEDEMRQAVAASQASLVAVLDAYGKHDDGRG